MNRVIANWQRLDDNSWGVAVRGGPGDTTRMQGKEVEVRKRDGSVKTVRLGAKVASWNGGRTTVYKVAR